MVSLKKSLIRKLTKKELLLVPSSFDTVGDIAIFNDVPKELKKKEKIIAQELLKLHKNIKVVAKKSKRYTGRLRTPKIQIIAGGKRKETIHKENGVQLKLDIEKCYFSARTGTERLRIAKLVKKDEVVLVLFSGVAPYPCVIAKNAKPKEIHAIEISKSCHKYAKENVKLNKLENITLFQGDVKKILPKINEKFDRIIMPLPKSADTYIALAKKKLKPKGTIHLYLFGREEEFSKLKKRFNAKKITKCGHYAPSVHRVCLDIKN